jgi:hypothetical protein
VTEDAPDPLLAFLDDLDASRAGGSAGTWAYDQAGDELVVIDDPGAYLGGGAGPADAALIVAAVNALPHLVAAVRAVLHAHRPIRVQKGGKTVGQVCNRDRAPHPCAYWRAIADHLEPLTRKDHQ